MPGVFGTRTNSDSPDAGGPPAGSNGTPASSGQFPMLLPSLASLPNTPSAQARLLPIAYGRVKAAAYLIEASPPTVRQPGPFSGVAGSAPIGSVINSDGSAWKCVKGGFAVNAPSGQGADPAARIALHAYNTFDVVTNSGNVYQAIQNGTTDATGGPTGTGTNIIDGTTAWQYLGTTPYPIVVTADGLIWRYLQQLPYPLYIQSFLGALCEGEITGAVSFFVDKERYSAPSATDLGQITLLKGVDAVNQVPGYGDSMGYQHTALIAPASPIIAGGVPTGTQKEIPAYAVEINGVMFGAATPDVSPADIVNDLLTHTRRGCSWPSSRVGPTVTGTGAGDFRVYCDATGARFSMYIDSQRSALSLLADILNATSCDALWSQGALKIVPLGDQPIASPVYGATGYVPNNTAQYNLSETDFLEPIQITRAPDSDCYNSFPIEFVDRSTVYQRNTVEDPDQTDIDSKGMIWRASTVSLPLVFPDGTYPIMLSRIYAQRSLYVRNTYTFKLPWRYLLLEPTDIVTLSDANMGFGQAAGGFLPASIAAGVTALTVYNGPASNLCPNPGFETNTGQAGAGTADGWGSYNNAPGLEPSTMSIVAGKDGANAQQISWAVNNTSTKGVLLQGGATWGVAGGWQPFQTYLIEYYCKATGTNIGQTMNQSTDWNTNPATVAVLANPPLTSSFQRYAFRITWGAVVEHNGVGGLFLSIANASGTQGTLVFDDVTIRQYGYSDFPPSGSVIIDQGTAQEEVVPYSAFDGAVLACLATQKTHPQGAVVSFVGSYRPVRIISMREGEDFTWEVVAEDYPAGVAASGAYTPQAGDGYKPNTAGTAAGGIPTSFGTGALTSPGLSNIWPNPTSENSPPAGYAVANDNTNPEFDYRSNVGASAFDGNWVRSLPTGKTLEFSFPTTRDEIIQLTARMKNLSGTSDYWLALYWYDGSGGLVQSNTQGFYNASGGGGTWGAGLAWGRSPATAVKVVARLGSPNSSGTNHYDSISLIRLPPTGPVPGLGQLSTTISSGTTFNLVDCAFVDRYEFIVTTAANWTIGAPTSPYIGQRLGFKIKNTSGGAISTTWNIIFKKAAWTDPATGNSHSIEFVYDGTNFVETSRTTVAVPN